MRHISILINAATLLSNGTSVDRQAGFTDGWYDGESESQVLSDRDKALINLRAALLPPSSSIVGARISLLNADGQSKGRSRPYKLSLTGGFGEPTDDPRMSLKYSVYANGKTNELQYYMQNVPDILIQTGSYRTNANWDIAVRQYFGYAFNNSYKFFGFNQEANQNPIIGITAPGVVTIERGNLFAFGQYARVIDTRTNLRGHYRQNPKGHLVTASVGQTVTLDSWTAGACTGGRLQIWEKQLFLPLLDDTNLFSPLVCTKKVGKPFFQYRGRASNRA